MRAPLPPEKRMRAAETSGEIAPPSTMMPSGAPRVASQRGKRSSRGMIRVLPRGESPRIASRIRLAKASVRPMRAKRVGSSKRPRIPMQITRLDGMAKKPRILESGKNISAVPGTCPGRSALCTALHRIRDAWHSASLLLPSGVARLGLLVHGIEAGKFRPTLDFADDEALHALVFGTLLGYKSEGSLRDPPRPVVVADDDVAGKDRAAAAADRLLPADESQAIDRGRRRSPRAPDRQFGGKHAGLVAHDTVGHQRRHIALHHAHGQDVAEDAGRGNTHRIGHGNATFGHFFDGAASGDRLRPAFRGSEILAHGHEAQRESRTHEARAAGDERARPLHPAPPDALFQKHSGDCCGGDRPQRLVKGDTHGTPLWQTRLANLKPVRCPTARRGGAAKTRTGPTAAPSTPCRRSDRAEIRASRKRATEIRSSPRRDPRRSTLRPRRSARAGRAGYRLRDRRIPRAGTRPPKR